MRKPYPLKSDYGPVYKIKKEDGKWYVSCEWPIRSAFLPREPVFEVYIDADRCNRVSLWLDEAATWIREQKP